MVSSDREVVGILLSGEVCGVPTPRDSTRALAAGARFRDDSLSQIGIRPSHLETVFHSRKSINERDETAGSLAIGPVFTPKMLFQKFFFVIHPAEQQQENENIQYQTDDAPEYQHETDHGDNQPGVTRMAYVLVETVSFQLVIGLNCYQPAEPRPKRKHSG
jgi:hypothetical protein